MRDEGSRGLERELWKKDCALQHAVMDEGGVTEVTSLPGAFLSITGYGMCVVSFASAATGGRAVKK